MENRKPNISYFHPFGCTFYILNTKDHLNKYDSKAQKCILLGYSKRSKGYRVYNTETLIVEESIKVRFDDKLGHQKPKQTKNSVGTEVQLINSEESKAKDNSEDPSIENALDNLRMSEEPSQKRFPRITSAHPEDMIIGKKDDPIRTRSSLKRNEESLFGLVSMIKPT